MGVAAVLRAVRVAAIILIGLLVCPPLAVFVFLIVAPALVIALGIGLLAAVVSTPYLLVQHLRGHRGGHVSLVAFACVMPCEPSSSSRRPGSSLTPASSTRCGDRSGVSSDPSPTAAR